MKFRYRFPKNKQMSFLMKNFPVGAELLHADRQKDKQTLWS